MKEQRAYRRLPSILPIPDHIGVLTRPPICSLGVSRGISTVVADGVEILDLLLVLRNVVAEAERIVRETHSEVHVTDECSGSYKPTMGGGMSVRLHRKICARKEW